MLISDKSIIAPHQNVVNSFQRIIPICFCAPKRQRQGNGKPSNPMFLVGFKQQRQGRQGGNGEEEGTDDARGCKERPDCSERPTIFASTR